MWLHADLECFCGPDHIFLNPSSHSSTLTFTRSCERLPLAPGPVRQWVEPPAGAQTITPPPPTLKVTSADSPLGCDWVCLWGPGHLESFFLFLFFFVREKGFSSFFFLRWLGVALHSELGAQMAPEKPRPLQATSGERTPQRLEATPLLKGDRRVGFLFFFSFSVKLKAEESDYGTWILYNNTRGPHTHTVLSEAFRHWGDVFGQKVPVSSFVNVQRRLRF